MQAPAVIDISGFGKRYGRKTAVHDVTLCVERGQLYGLIGADGAGKSSVMKAVAGVLSFDAGHVRVFDCELDSERAAEPVKARLGFMPQGLGLNLYPELSVEENIDLFAHLRLVAPEALAERKQMLLGMTRLAPFRTRPMNKLSGGMKQKLGLVCTLIHAPELIILDEPTTGVDPVSRRDFWFILAQLIEQQGLTALVSTAYLDEASRFDRLALMHGGRVLAEGEPYGLAHGAQAGELEDLFVELVGTRDALPALPIAVAPGPGGRSAAREDHAIHADALTRDFGAFRAVDGASFDVHAGEIFGLLGANGAGKTTVIKMLTGILPPTRGVGRVAGADMRHAGRTIKQRVGYMSQAFSLYTDLTVMQNLLLFAGVYGLDRRLAAERARWVLELGGLVGMEHSAAGSLPMGQRQRLALGCALIHRPRVLFLDEPTSGVDPIGRRRFWDILHALAHDDGVAILLTTHTMREADLCDRLALMFDGRVVADATPAQMKAEFTAEQGHLLAVSVARPLVARALLREAGFAQAELHGRRVYLCAPDAAAATARIHELLAGAGLADVEVTPQQPSMEDVFVQRVLALEAARHQSPDARGEAHAKAAA